MLVDKIPHNGVIDIETISFTAVRYNWAEVPAGGNPHYASAAAGTVMPIESGSNWLPVSQYYTQSSSDTYDSFYAKIKAQKLSYGVFRELVIGKTKYNIIPFVLSIQEGCCKTMNKYRHIIKRFFQRIFCLVC